MWGFDISNDGNIKFEKEKFNFLTISIITIGVGGYLIKNFTEKK